MGLVVLEGLIIPSWCSPGFRHGRVHGGPAPAEDGDQRRHRPVHRAHRPRRRRLRPHARRPARCPSSSASAGYLDGWPMLVFVVGLLAIIVLIVARGARARSSSASSAPPSWRSSSRRSPTSAASSTHGKSSTRPAGASTSRRCPDKIVDVPDFGAARQLHPASASFEQASASSPRVLLVFTLLLADFFDTMGTMVGVGAEAGPARRGRQPAQRRADPARRLGRRRRRWRGLGLVEHVLHRVRGRRRRGRPHRPRLGRHRRAVPAGHVLHAAGRRSSPTRRRRRPWSSSAS